jgi:hypothetical protein
MALRIQGLRSREPAEGDPPLLRIDSRDEAARAPYQFDSVRGRLHRRECRFIPPSSRSALYALWHVSPEEEKLACPQCRPVPTEGGPADDGLATDLVYGLLSILDQFGGVLRERGREYRKSAKGRHLRVDLESLYRGLGEREQQTLDVITTALDGVVRKIRDLDQSLNGRSRSDGNGRHE